MSAPTNLWVFEARVSDDEVKQDLELFCLLCETHLCDIEHKDTLAVLVNMANDHVCPPKDFPQGPDDAKVCVHGNIVWFGNECGECEGAEEGYVWAEESDEWECSGCHRRIQPSDVRRHVSECEHYDGSAGY